MKPSEEKVVEHLHKLKQAIIAYTGKIDAIKALVGEMPVEMQEPYFSKIKRFEKRRDCFVVRYGQLKNYSDKHGPI
jgi:hypothetical protein